MEFYIIPGQKSAALVGSPTRKHAIHLAKRWASNTCKQTKYILEDHLASPLQTMSKRKVHCKAGIYFSRKTCLTGSKSMVVLNSVHVVSLNTQVVCI